MLTSVWHICVHGTRVHLLGHDKHLTCSLLVLSLFASKQMTAGLNILFPGFWPSRQLNVPACWSCALCLYLVTWGFPCAMGKIWQGCLWLNFYSSWDKLILLVMGYWKLLGNCVHGASSVLASIIPLNTSSNPHYVLMPPLSASLSVMCIWIFLTEPQNRHCYGHRLQHKSSCGYRTGMCQEFPAVSFLFNW